jgi:hypothetical protein
LNIREATRENTPSPLDDETEDPEESTSDSRLPNWTHPAPNPLLKVS